MTKSQAMIGCWRVLVYGDPDGNAVFSMDQPSSAFGSLGIAGVTEVGWVWTVRWQTSCGSSGLTPVRRSGRSEY
jgi:hypothetical protein